MPIYIAAHIKKNKTKKLFDTRSPCHVPIWNDRYSLTWYSNKHVFDTIQLEAKNQQERKKDMENISLHIINCLINWVILKKENPYLTLHPRRCWKKKPSDVTDYYRIPCHFSFRVYARSGWRLARHDVNWHQCHERIRASTLSNGIGDDFFFG